MVHDGRITRLLTILATVAVAATARAVDDPATKASIWIDPSVSDAPVTGRVLLLVSDPRRGEPRLVMPYTFAYYFNDPGMPYPQIFGADAEQLEPGTRVTIDQDTLGFPFASLAELPPREYAMQAILHVYTKFERADGHTIWAHLDQGEGHQFHLAPGNLVSELKRMRLDPEEGFEIELPLTRKIPPITRSGDSEHLKRMRIKSELVSEFWGHDMFVNATVLLPKGYDEHPDVRYPVLYYQGHFFEDPPFNFPEQVPDDARQARRFYFPNPVFRNAWLSDDMPRMIVVTFQHPTPYYDDSYFVDSANNGPWGRALIEEVIPAVEERFRIIRKPYARVMTGGSTGGWVSAALQIYHPKFFGGAWSFCPDPVDFREMLGVDLYREQNAFTPDGYYWRAPERYASRTVKGLPRVTIRETSQFSLVLGNRCRSGEFLDNWNAVHGPVGSDGYPQPIWDHTTGEIDHEVAEYWRDNGFDLRHYVEENWSEIGPDLVGKLHFSVGDMDNFFLNLGVYRMEDFLEDTHDPPYGGSFLYGRPMVGHTVYGYRPYPVALLEEMADHIARNAPEGDDPDSWHYAE